jgi:hypothetical protein
MPDAPPYPIQRMSHLQNTSLALIALALSLLSVACSEAPPCPSGSFLQGEAPTPKLLKSLIEKGEHRASYESVCMIPGPHGPLMHGVYQAWYGDGKTLRASITYEGGVKHGEYKLYYESGQLKEEGSYQYGLKQGRFSTYHRNGNLHVEGTYVDNKRSGDFTITSDNEMNIQKGPYFMGYKHGNWTSEYVPLKGESVTLKAFYHYGVVVNTP